MKRYLQCAEQQESLSKLTKYCPCHEKWISWLILVTHETLSIQCAEQQVSSSKLTKYCACHDKWISWLILVTHETLFTMRGATSVIVQTHQILRLPRKMNLMIDPCHTWNAIYNARSNKCHCPNSPNTAPATQSDCHDWSLSHMKRYLQCGEQQMASSNITEYCACHAKWLSWLILVTYETSFTMRGATSVLVQTHQYCACHEKWISWLILVTHETLFTMRGATSVIVQTHQILRLPRKMTLQNFVKISRKQLKRHFQCGADPSRIRAGSENETVTPQPASQPRLLFTPTTGILYWKIQHFALRLSFQISPNAAPATKSDSSTSPNTAPAIAKWLSWLILVTYETLFTMRGTTDGILQHHRILRLPRKMTVMTDPCHIWNVNLQCAEQQVSLSKLTKYCACHEKWISWLILVTHETLFTMRGATIKCHCPNSPKILRLPRKMTLQNFAKISRKQLKRHFQCGADPSRFRAGSEQDPSRIREWNRHSATRLATEVTFHAHHGHFVLKNTTFRAPAIIPNFTECCACHEKWQFNITKYFTLPRKVTVMTWLSCDLPELLLDWLDWAITWLTCRSYDLTWAMTCRSYDLTELLLD